MGKKFICGGEKYVIGGPKEDTIALPIFPAGLPDTITIERDSLFRKTSFHVSLVCIGKIIEKQNVSTPNFQDKIVADFCEFTQKNNVDLLRYRDEFRFAFQNERKAIIAMCDVSNLESFFMHVNQKYGLSIEYPPTHVTLYTLQPDKGIFLTDSGDIEKLTKLISNPGIVLQ
ncbi:MAG: hypothetical protein HY435_00730 [Candidatus Liptonbacteria bacterium]|nr:hypothetical protein [Candidatus Liptonbacteria bacterium]